MRWRNMYHMTGLPGWMRFGFSPGWAGRSASGMGPCAQYLMTGQWPTPQMQMAWQGMQAGGPAAAVAQPPVVRFGPSAASPDPQVQLQFLKSQAEMLSGQLEQVIRQLEGLGQDA